MHGRHVVHVHIHALRPADSMDTASDGHGHAATAAACHAWVVMHAPLALPGAFTASTGPATALVRRAGFDHVAARGSCMRLMLRLVAVGARLLPIACAQSGSRQHSPHMQPSTERQAALHNGTAAYRRQILRPRPPCTGICSQVKSTQTRVETARVALEHVSAAAMGADAKVGLEAPPGSRHRPGP